MPPRARTKRGLKRIDAAIDALVPLGFSKEAVRKTVNNLLKVYGGDDGWVFIEEASYKLVVETILEEQEKDGAEEEAEAMDESALEVSEPIVEAGETSIQPPAIMDRAQSDISSVDQGLVPGQLGHCECALTSAEVERQSSAREDMGPSYSQHPNEPPRRRLPCHGWISESEDDEDAPDDVSVNQVQDMTGNAGGARRIRKRPSGWDVRPDT